MPFLASGLWPHPSGAWGPVLAGLTLGLLAHSAAANVRPMMRAFRAESPMRLDGKLDEPDWQKAPASTAFTQKFPDEGKAPSERTTVRVVYDHRAIYFGIECEQRRSPVTARLTRRDRAIEADWVSVNLDSRADGTTAFEFMVNAAGTLTDSVRYDDTAISADWDENWDARTRITANGWTAEIRIPLRVLRFDDKKKEQTFGFQVRRYISARQETDEWSFIPRNVTGEVSRYGRLTGLAGLRSVSPIELRPFVLGRVRRRDPGLDTLAKGTDFDGSLGLDLKWHIGQNLTLDATINPDFAQVEADQIVFNLTNLEIFYPEKRPFFLEGYDTFATPFFRLLYTRRIGSVPSTPTLRTTPAEQLYDYPSPSSIYGALKLVGTVLPRLSVGLLSAVTSREDAPIQRPDGGREGRLAVPASVYNVLRLKLALGSNSHLGLMATATNRIEPEGAYPLADPSRGGQSLCPTGDIVAVGRRCFQDAYTGGFDFRWRSPSGQYTVVAQGVGSMLEGGPPRGVRDGTLIESGAVSGGGTAMFIKDGGEPWVGQIGYDGAGRKLDLNDVGYLPRGNYHSLWAELGYRVLSPWWKTLETTTKLGFYQNFSWTGLALDSAFYFVTTWKLSSFWTLGFEAKYSLPYYDDREVGDGSALQHERGFAAAVRLTSDPRTAISGELYGGTFQRPNGDFFLLQGRLTLRLHPQLDLDVLPEAYYSYGEPRYVGSGTTPGELVFGRLLGRSLGTTLRATFTFTPRLSLQAFTQLFLSSKHYRGFTSLLASPSGPRPEVRLRDLRPSAAPETNPDVQEGILNVNVVLRWEYLLGSTLFLVYTRSQVPARTLLPGEAASLELGAIQRGPASDAVMLKLSYWWG